MTQFDKMEVRMKKLAKDYAINVFALNQNDDLIPYYLHLREEIQCALMQMSQEERNIIAFSFLFPENRNWWKSFYEKKDYDMKKNLALDSFFRCLKL